jgi:hypothetical protein
MKLQAFVAEMVLDDDASTELTSHCLREMAENMLNYEWPVDLMEKRFQNQRWASYRSTTQSRFLWI